jgi:hypothetical protein
MVMTFLCSSSRETSGKEPEEVDAGSKVLRDLDAAHVAHHMAALNLT